MTPLDRLRALHAAYESEGSGYEQIDFAEACGNAMPSLLACVDALREAKELAEELHGYCVDMWEWKYGKEWTERLARIDAALAPLLEEQP